jgi:hypothetical protein
MPYQPIEDYGIVGNLRTAALIGMNGSVDWLCLPRFDSPSVFGTILDEGKGGYFQIARASSEVTHKQLYWPDTNILITRFLSDDGVGEIIDFMPILAEQDSEMGRLIRRAGGFGSARSRSDGGYLPVIIPSDKHKSKAFGNRLLYRDRVSLGDSTAPTACRSGRGCWGFSDPRGGSALHSPKLLSTPA